MLNERLSEEELNYQLSDSSPDYLLVDDYAKRTLSFANKWSFEEIKRSELTAFEVENEWSKEGHQNHYVYFRYDWKAKRGTTVA